VRRTISILAALGLLLGAGHAAAGGGDADVGAEAVWAWSWTSDHELSEITAGAGFSTVYLFAEGGFDGKVRRAIATLRGAGLSVEALAGEPTWALAGHRDGLLEFVRSVTRYQRNADPGLRLAGIHLDIEPHALERWDHNREALIHSYLAGLDAASEAAGAIPVNADIPFWYDAIRFDGRALLGAVLRRVDGVTVMAYRDTGPDVVDVARAEVAAAARLGKRATVGVETDKVTPEKVTFYEEGRAALIQALAEIRDAFAADPGFGGLAVHHATSLADLD
jgi:hypothetical protein